MRNLNLKLAALAILAVPFAAFATPAPSVDFSGLTGGISLTGVVTAVLAVAAVKVSPLVAAWGARKILSMVGR